MYSLFEIISSQLFGLAKITTTRENPPFFKLSQDTEMRFCSSKNSISRSSSHLDYKPCEETVEICALLSIFNPLSLLFFSRNNFFIIQFPFQSLSCSVNRFNKVVASSFLFSKNDKVNMNTSSSLEARR